MDLSLLKQFGLHKNDLSVYESLLSIGRSKTGDVIKKTGIGSSQTYYSLNRLIDKGLVSYLVKNNIRYYQAELPSTLIEESRKHITELEALTKELKNLPIEKRDRNEVNIFEGKRGFKKVFTDHVSGLKKDDSISIISFSPRLTDSKELWSFFRNLDKTFLPKECEARMILDRRLQKDMAEQRLNLIGYSVRYMPSGYFNPSAINISKKEVLISIWGENPLVVRIRNTLIKKSFEQNFEFLWKSAKPR